MLPLQTDEHRAEHQMSHLWSLQRQLLHDLLALTATPAGVVSRVECFGFGIGSRTEIDDAVDVKRIGGVGLSFW